MSLANSIREGGFGDSGNIKVRTWVDNRFFEPSAFCRRDSERLTVHLRRFRPGPMYDILNVIYHHYGRVWKRWFMFDCFIFTNNLSHALDWCVKDKTTNVAHFGREFSGRRRDGFQVKAQIPDPTWSLQVIPLSSTLLFTNLTGWRCERGDLGRSPRSLGGTSTSTMSSSTTSTMRSSRRTSLGFGATWSRSRTFFGRSRTSGSCRCMESATSPLGMSPSRTS